MTAMFRNALDVGTRIDRYEVEAVIGHGGFGISYRAMDAESGARVVLKEFLPAELATRDADASVYPLSESHVDNFQWGLERFLEEARLLERFRHPNIVRVRRAFEGNGTAYMAMDHEPGESLAKRLEREETLQCEALFAMTLALLDALEVVHDAGYIHRDIKPSNILLRVDGGPVLLDFGSARQALKGKTRTLTALVSAGYAPLEQYFSRSDLQGPWTDIYGLGATLYHAMSGEAPIDAVERSRGVLGSTQDILTPASEAANGAYPPSLLAAVDHALRVEERDRPRDVAQWRKEITGEIAVPESPVTTFETPRTRQQMPVTEANERDASRIRRNGMALIGFVAVASLALGTLLWWSSSGPVEGDVRNAERPRPATGEDRIAPNYAALRTSLSDAQSELAKSRARAGELTAKLRELESTPTADDGRSNGPAAMQDDRSHSDERDALITELRAELQTAYSENRSARQRADELAARLKLLEALQKEQSAEATNRQQEIEKLLAQAERDMGRMRLTTPADGNAFDRYRLVLELDEDNADALQGLERIVDEYVGLAGQAQSSKQYRKAEAYLNRASLVLPGHGALADARAALAQARRARDSVPSDAGQNDPVTAAMQRTISAEHETNEPVASTEPALRKAATPGPILSPTKQEPRLESLRIAVLPSVTSTTRKSHVELELVEFTHSFVDEHEGLELAYAYYSSDFDSIDAGGPRSYWSESYTNPEPIASRVYAAANRLEADVVLMYHYEPRIPGWYSPELYNAEIFLFDSQRRRLYRDSTDERHIEATMSELLEELTRSRTSATGQSAALNTSTAGTDMQPPLAIAGEVEGDKAAPVTIAILRFGRRQSSRRHFNALITEKLTEQILELDGLRLTYSYYPLKSNASRIDVSGLWKGDMVNAWLNEERALAIGRELNVDLVVTVRNPITHIGMSGDLRHETDYVIDVYLMDVRRERLYHDKGEVGVADKVLRRLLAKSGLPGDRSKTIAADVSSPNPDRRATPAAEGS